MANLRGLKYVSWGDNTGYAIAAKGYLRALANIGTSLSWFPMVPSKTGYEVFEGETWTLSPDLAYLYRRSIDYDTVLVHTVPEYFPDWVDREKAAGKRVFGYTVWELERLPDHWPAILNRLDGVIVPCHWNVQVFRASGVTVPIHVVPHLSQFEGISASAADRSAIRNRTGVAADRFMFYTIGFWSNRKAPYLAIEAFLRAFSADDAVALVVKTGNSDIAQLTRDWRSGFRRRHPKPDWSVSRLRAGFPRAPLVKVISDETLSDGEMLALHERGDCFVSLTRTEGWGLGAFEAARLGKPVVMTGYGGQLDYLDPELSWLVPYSMVQVKEPAWPGNYRPNDRWAEPSIGDAAGMLRSVFEDREKARNKAKRQADRIADRFGQEATVATLLKALS